MRFYNDICTNVPNLSFLTLIYKYVEKYDNPCQPE